MDTEAIKALSAAREKLFAKLFSRQEELRRCELSCGKAHDIRKMNRLRDEISSLEKRLDRCERMMETY